MGATRNEMLIWEGKDNKQLTTETSIRRRLDKYLRRALIVEGRAGKHGARAIDISALFSSASHSTLFHIYISRGLNKSVVHSLLCCRRHRSDAQRTINVSVRLFPDQRDGRPRSRDESAELKNYTRSLARRGASALWKSYYFSICPSL